MSIIKWLPEAKIDLQRLHDFIQPHNPDAAQRAILTLIEATDHLGKFPEAGRPRGSNMGYREWLVRFGAKGYVIRYRIFEDQIIIIRIWHGVEGRFLK